MKTYVLLLRGVMPSGKNKVPMKQLREVLGKHGFENVRTYIASGNALVETDLSVRDIETKVHHLIKQHIGPDLTIIVRTGAQLQKILDENPFKKGHDISRVFFVSFAHKPASYKIDKLQEEDFGDCQLKCGENAAYMYIPGDASRSKLSNNFLEKKLDVSATMRNFNTMSKLIEMSHND